VVKDKVFITEDGSHSMFSEKHGVSYHSKYGAIQETEHVFINAAFRHQLPSSSLSILDIGFGTGLNAYMTLLEANQHKVKIDYTGIEAYPISIETAQTLNYAELLQQDNSIFQQLHKVGWEEVHTLSAFFNFIKNKKRFEDLNFENEFDIIYFDTFAPNAQPELWEETILQKMYDALKIGGVLTTYCAKGVVKRTLKKVGFTIEAIPGPPGKREMTRGVKYSQNVKE